MTSGGTRVCTSLVAFVQDGGEKLVQHFYSPLFDAPPWDIAGQWDDTDTNDVPVGATQVVAALPNKNRVGILFSNSSGNNIFVTTLDVAVNGRGIVVSPGQYPVTLFFKDVGPVVTKQWNAIGAAAALHLCVMEIVMSRWDPSEAMKYGKDQSNKRGQRSRAVIGYSPTFLQSPQSWINDLSPSELPVQRRTKWQGSDIRPRTNPVSDVGTNNYDQ